MKKSVWFLFASLLSFSSLACFGKSVLDGWYVPELTIEKYMEATKSSDKRDKERVLWFFNGVADATKGNLWCPRDAKILSKNLELIAFDRIRKMDQTKIKTKRASELLIETLSYYMPCKEQKK